MRPEEGAGSGAVLITIFGDDAGLALELAKSLASAIDERSGSGTKRDDSRVALYVPDTARTRPGANEFAQTIGRLRAGRQAVVVVMDGPFREEVLVAIDRSDRVVLVTDGRPPSVRATRRLLKLTTTLGFGVDRLGVVLIERGDREGVLDADGLSAALQRDILAVLPAEPSADQRGRFVDALVPQGVRDCSMGETA
jgi:hypothetical protein